MKYYLAGPRYAKADPRPVSERTFDAEIDVVKAAYQTFYERPVLRQIDVVRLDSTRVVGESRTKIVMKLHRRRGKADPAVWLASTDEVTEPTR